MSEVPEPNLLATAPAIDPGAILDRDLPCHGCGYNLRGLPLVGRCPECGAPVIIATAGQAIQFARLPWVRRLALGARIAAMGGFLLLASGGVVALLGWSGIPRVGGAVMACVWTAFVIGELIAFWLIASPNECDLQDEHWLSDRRRVRYAALSLPLTIMAWGLPSVGAFGFHWFIIALLGAPLGLTGFLGQQAICRHCLYIAKRIDNGACVDAARRYRTGYRRSWPVFALGVALCLVGAAPVGAVLIVASIVFVLFHGAMALCLPITIASELRAYAQWAEQCWSAAEKYAAAHSS